MTKTLSREYVGQQHFRDDDDDVVDVFNDQRKVSPYLRYISFVGVVS